MVAVDGGGGSTGSVSAAVAESRNRVAATATWAALGRCSGSLSVIRLTSSRTPPGTSGPMSGITSRTCARAVATVDSRWNGL